MLNDVYVLMVLEEFDETIEFVGRNSYSAFVEVGSSTCLEKMEALARKLEEDEHTQLDWYIAKVVKYSVHPQ